jgi:hypothetical protein
MRQREEGRWNMMAISSLNTLAQHIYERETRSVATPA